jgi:5-methylcytosine-specific restriction endonuclease McrA
METKCCNRCNIVKTVDLFYREKAKHRSICKACEVARGKQYYLDNKEAVKAKRAIYQKAHLAEQYVHNQAWRKRNVEKVREAGRRQYANDIVRKREVKNSWRKQNSELVKGYLEKYRIQHLPKMAEKAHKRRVKVWGNGVYLVKEKELNRLYKSPCVNCGTKERITVDHVIPVVRGGKHSIGNLQPLCLSCNASKNSKTMAEWKHFLRLKGVSSVSLCES